MYFPSGTNTEKGMVIKMESVIKEITAIRHGAPVMPDRSNSNRYCVITYEEDGTKTAYCFGVPVYSDKTGKLVNLSFKEKDNIFYTYGSSATVTADKGGKQCDKNHISGMRFPNSFPAGSADKNSGTVTLENCLGYCRALFPENSFKKYGRGIKSESIEIYPTLNGILVIADIGESESFTFNLLSQLSHLSVRSNSRSFSLMRKEFTPFVTVSSVGIFRGSGKFVSPVSVKYQKINDKVYNLKILPCSDTCGKLVFEINMYEPKLIQDTTVESANPYENNAFGGIAFIGNTKEYGEQWVYSRADIDKISVFIGRTVNRAVLHIPRLCGELSMEALRLTKRFCSFGANWDNKITDSDALIKAELNKDYYTVDVTDIISSDKPRTIIKSEGLILKPSSELFSKSDSEQFSKSSSKSSSKSNSEQFSKFSSTSNLEQSSKPSSEQSSESYLKTRSEISGFTAVATGDSYFMPQVLEINFK